MTTKSIEKLARLPKRPRILQLLERLISRPTVMPGRDRIPLALAGKWLAWSDGKIVASGESLAEVRAFVRLHGIKGASFELASRARRLPSVVEGC